MKTSNKILRSVTGTILIMISLAFTTSDTFINDLKAKLQNYTTPLPEETVYLHIDKPLYFPGEDIWFTAYVMDKGENIASDISDVLYVEWVDPRGNTVKKLTLPIEEGVAHGDFSIGAEMSGGLYKLKAYTHWMKNSRPTFYERDVNIQNFIAPNLLLSVDFDKENYGAGETVVVDFECKDLKGEFVKGESFSYGVSIGGNSFLNADALTGNDGTGKIIFSLPEDLDTRDVLINIKITHEGLEESISRNVPISMRNIDLKFYPEGGDLIADRSNTVAFEALNDVGLPVDIRGELYNKDGTLIDVFESFHMGMGKFSIAKPEKGAYVKVTSPGNLSNNMFELPNPVKSDYQLRLKSNKQCLLKFDVNAPTGAPYYVVGQMHGKIVFDTTMMNKTTKAELLVPVEHLGIGIIQFTLFNAAGDGECERLVFINRDKQMQVEITPDRDDYINREKVKLKVRTTNIMGEPVPANLSVAVVDDKVVSFADDKQDHILSYFHLSSELKGNIREPKFYFDTTEQKSLEALDLLMLTHGWRRFTWKDVFKGPRSIYFKAEKFDNVKGVVLNTKTNTPVRTPVYLLEMNNGNRFAKVKTQSDGAFNFFNVDPTASVEIVAMSKLKREKNWKIYLDSQLPEEYIWRYEEQENGFKMPTDFEIVPELINQKTEKEEENYEPSESGFALQLTPDISSLSEIVIVGYGVQRRSTVTGSIATVTYDEIVNIPAQSIESMLSGRVAGVTVMETRGAPASRILSQLRGMQQISGRQPLIVIDDMILGNNASGNMNIMDYVHPEDINNITVYPAPRATGVYGSLGANGVIIVSTDRRNHYGYTPINKNYANLRIDNFQKRSLVREFYLPSYEVDTFANYVDNRQTIYWNHSVTTDENGEAELEFYTNDLLTNMRVITEGVGHNGLIGRGEETFAIGDPINLDMKLPAYALSSDEISIPVSIFNNSDDTVKVKVSLDYDVTRLRIHSPKREVSLLPNHVHQEFFSGRILTNINEKVEITARLEGGSRPKKTSKSVEVYQMGFPVQVSLSSASLSSSYSFNINNLVPGTMNSTFTAYLEDISPLFDGIESMLREPHGCFEQVSSTNYPNIMVLQLLKELKLSNPTIENKARAFLRSGYNKLTNYEVPGGGFEWFGHIPAHEGLTAYGLMQFVDMKEVYDGVDSKLIDRTRKWLLDRRDGNGGFKIKSGKYGFSGAPQAVGDAYLVYALSYVGENDIEKEYNKVLEECLDSKDTYRLALILNTAHYRNDSVNYEKVLNVLTKIIDTEGLGNLPADHSIVHSYGKSLQVEISALLLMGILDHDPHSQKELIKNLYEFLISNRSYGYFGSTQATILSLKALSKYNMFTKRLKEDGEINIFFNEELVRNMRFFKDDDSDIEEAVDLEILVKDSNKVNVQFANCKSALNYSLDMSWRTSKPSSSDDCPVDLSINTLMDRVKVNETFRVEVNIQNKDSVWKPMTMATIGIPAGLSLQIWQLNRLLEEKQVDYYEIMNGYLVLYFKEMGPGEMKTIILDLKADLPGNYQGQASSAYLYYMDEAKDWEHGIKVSILK